MQIGVSPIPIGKKTLSQLRDQLEAKGFVVENSDNELVVHPSSAASYLIKSWGTAYILKNVALKKVNDILEVRFHFRLGLVFGAVVIFAGLIGLAYVDGSLKQEELPQTFLAFLICLPIMFGIISLSLVSSFKRELK